MYKWIRSNSSLVSDHTQFSYLCFCFSFDLWSQQCPHSLHNEHFPCFLRYPFWQLQTTEVNKYKLITKTDRKKNVNSRGIKISTKKRHYNCEKLNTWSHSQFPVAILMKYGTHYYIPHPRTPLCNTDQVITPLWDMTCCISNLSNIHK